MTATTANAATVSNGSDHHSRRSGLLWGSSQDVTGPDDGNGGGSGTLGFTVSIAEFSVRAALVVALALVALVLSGRRKPARPWQRAPRGQATPLAVAVDRRGRRVLVPVDRRTNRFEARSSAVKVVSSGAGLGIIGVVAGAVTAIAVATGVAWVVTTVTGLLR